MGRALVRPHSSLTRQRPLSSLAYAESRISWSSLTLGGISSSLICSSRCSLFYCWRQAPLEFLISYLLFRPYGLSLISNATSGAFGKERLIQLMFVYPREQGQQIREQELLQLLYLFNLFNIKEERNPLKEGRLQLIYPKFQFLTPLYFRERRKKRERNN